MRHNSYNDAIRAAAGAPESYEKVAAAERDILIGAGLKPYHYLINVGCGGGRLESALVDYLTGPLLGTDVVPLLLKHARKTFPQWRFERVTKIVIPEKDECADMVCFFSVFTHLLHQDSYRYLQEARRVLKPGGIIVFSFLDFTVRAHWPIFETTVGASRRINQLNQFISHDAIEAWAEMLGLEIIRIESEGQFGQSVCILAKP